MIAECPYHHILHFRINNIQLHMSQENEAELQEHQSAGTWFFRQKFTQLFLWKAISDLLTPTVCQRTLELFAFTSFNTGGV